MAKPEPSISVEAVCQAEDRSAMFWVTRIRGGASAAVLYSRDELEELRRRIDAALLID